MISWNINKTFHDEYLFYFLYIPFFFSLIRIIQAKTKV